MDIVLCINDTFVPHAAALTASVLEHTSLSAAGNCPGRASFIFHILSNGVCKENQERLSEHVRRMGAEVRFYDLGDFEGRLEKLLGAKAETGKFANAVLGRIFAPEYLPREIKRFVYLDTDMIARHDIQKLERVLETGSETGCKAVVTGSLKPEGTGNGQKCIVAAVAEPTIYEDLVIDGKAYFNSGLLAVDREAWDRENITKKCLDWFAGHNGSIAFADQDILNHVLAGRILPLSPRWNFQTNYHYRSYDSLVKKAPWYGEMISREEYEQSASDPVIVHYAGDERPWIRGNQNPYRKDYEEALAKTPWKDTPPVEGREGYMRFYHLVNVLSQKIPGFRSLVSKIYYQTKIKK